MQKVSNKFINFKSLGIRLALGFGVVMIIFSALASMNVVSMYRSSLETEVLIEEDMKMLIISEELAINMLERTNYLQAFALTGNRSYADTFIDGTADSLALEESALERDDSEQLQTIIDRKMEWGHSTDQMIKLVDQGDSEAALRLFENEVMPNSLALASDFTDLANQYEAHISKVGNELIVMNNNNSWISFIVGIVAVIIGIIIAIVTTLVISRPVRRLTDRMLTIANGDLSEEIEETDRRDEIGQLTRSTNQMAQNMRQLLAEIQNVSNTVTEHSDSLSATTNEVSEGAEQISGTMQELASGAETQATHASGLSSGMNDFVTNVSAAQVLGQSVEDESKNTRELTVSGSTLR